MTVAMDLVKTLDVIVQGVCTTTPPSSFPFA